MRKRHTVQNNGPDPIDIYVGSRIRTLRKTKRISQTVIANALGITWQQQQKYESGANRVAASRLFKIAHKLRVPVSYFFEGMDPNALPEASEIVAPKVAPKKVDIDLARAMKSLDDDDKALLIRHARLLAGRKSMHALAE